MMEYICSYSSGLMIKSFCDLRGLDSECSSDSSPSRIIAEFKGVGNLELTVCMCQYMREKKRDSCMSPG